ncbi:acetylglutamate kinase [Pleomorphomonas sp. SM30]|uniref:Acetylglutamate kinase n=2 Tax=Oharaeibacter diazotrophicus TaxID=1920512 RepID=A0A4R6RCI4_9HYPH|nr:acetylglutamate kinase [Oharaeibacter diazotrophicus]TDP83901.1 N-acetylglutamate kinase [Oharaeibacter diazotrophicus]BBE72943.1 acetylglutamate kinase [Pleomorphomonas sp. SM30]GLS74722.1 acetylglutamate kinase [Oharaeibacter diazotrophicus]
MSANGDVATTLSEEAMVSRARVISEALPYMQRYDDKTVVVKYGGHAMGDEALARAFARDIVLLKQSGMKPIVVHGGGPQIGAMLDKLGIKSEFRAGLRVTDKATVEIVEMVLAGSINKNIVSAINAEGGRAIGLCGKDGNLVVVERATRTMRDPDSNIERIVDLGFVGEPKTVNPAVLDMVAKEELIPVVAPVAPGEDGETYNVNADTFAGAIAGAMHATRLLFLTDVPGVLDKQGRLIKELSVTDARALIADGTISGGMIPKVETCIDALARGVEGVVIVNGKTPHAVLLEIFTETGAGTLITP